MKNTLNVSVLTRLLMLGLQRPSHCYKTVLSLHLEPLQQPAHFPPAAPGEEEEEEEETRRRRPHWELKQTMESGT